MASANFGLSSSFVFCLRRSSSFSSFSKVEISSSNCSLFNFGIAFSHDPISSADISTLSKRSANFSALSSAIIFSISHLLYQKKLVLHHPYCLSLSPLLHFLLYFLPSHRIRLIPRVILLTAQNSLVRLPYLFYLKLIFHTWHLHISQRFRYQP